MRAAQHALERIAGLLGDATRRDVLDVRAQLEPRGPVSRERPARDQHERSRHQPSVSRLGTKPIPDLAHVAGVVPANADRADHAAGRGVGDRERLLAEAADVGPCVLERVRLRDHVEPA